MYFAEVRHFEEIFRQGEQPPGGSAQDEQQEGGQDNARDSDQLAELQKEIINGTWKLVRRETGAKPTDKLAEDGKVLERGSAIGDREGRPACRAAARCGVESQPGTGDATDEGCREAIDGRCRQLVDPGAQSGSRRRAGCLPGVAQAARREFQVIRNNSRRQQQGGRSSGGRMAQRQLQQLELTSDENRYEEQRSARAREENLSQREREQRETRQVLNRLRELAQRQSDVNERLKELQSALEAAKTAQAQAGDRSAAQTAQGSAAADPARYRRAAESAWNKRKTANAWPTPESKSSRAASTFARHPKRSSKAGLAQALTEGARAGRQLNDLREELRKSAANRFTEEATDMRNQARRLSQDQQKLTEQLEAGNQS